MKLIEALKIERDRAGHDPEKLKELVELLLSYLRDLEDYTGREEQERDTLEKCHIGKALDDLLAWHMCSLSESSRAYWKNALQKYNRK